MIQQVLVVRLLQVAVPLRHVLRTAVRRTMMKRVAMLLLIVCGSMTRQHVLRVAVRRTMMKRVAMLILVVDGVTMSATGTMTMTATNWYSESTNSALVNRTPVASTSMANSFAGEVVGMGS